MAFGGHAWRQSCRVCRDHSNPDSARLRREWGCDEPTPEPQFELECPDCEGLHATCSTCSGSGVLSMHRCPLSVATAEHWAIIRAVDMLQHGVLPDAGGWAEQAGTCIDAMVLVLGARRRIEKRKRDREKAETTTRRRTR